VLFREKQDRASIGDVVDLLQEEQRLADRDIKLAGDLVVGEYRG